MVTNESWLALRSKSGDELLAEFIMPIKREFWVPPPRSKPTAPAAKEEGAETATTSTATTTATTTSAEEPPPKSGAAAKKAAARLRQREARSLKQCREWARSAECPFGDDCIFAHGDKPGKVSLGKGAGGGGGGGGAAATAKEAASAAPVLPPPPPPPPLPGRCPVDAAWPGSCEFAGGEEGRRCRWAIHGGESGSKERERAREERVALLCSLRQRFAFPSSSPASSSTNALTPELRTALFEGRYDYSPSIAVLDSLGLSHGVTGKLASQARARAKRRAARRKKKEDEEEGEGGGGGEEGEEGGGEKDDDAAAAVADDEESSSGGGTLFYRETAPHARERAAASSALALDLRDKLYLAPLTTVGNLPFRALAVGLGADVTCSEMALANNLLQGKGQEWALLKRHSSEKVWGVQIAGGHADALVRASQLVCDATDADFLDINMGCPIDLVAHKGAGAGVLARPKKIEMLVKAVSGVLRHPERRRDLPLTLKVRKGVKDGADSVHSWLPLVAAGQWGSGVAAVTVHGRSKQQRYSRDSDWGYVGEVARLCRAANPDFQVVSSGDVSCFREYEALRRGEAGEAVAGVMLARGALVKPWLFSEIKERRDIDLPSNERLELYRRFAELGLSHWGSDARGVETSRRFFLEWMGFAHRYVPVGLVEEEALRRDAERAVRASAAAAAAAARAAADDDDDDDDGDGESGAKKPSPSWVSPSARRMLRLRSPRYTGRDDLETLLASPEPQDWVKISEMLFGPAPTGFKFQPKHKSNAYSASAALDGESTAVAADAADKAVAAVGGGEGGEEEKED